MTIESVVNDGGLWLDRAMEKFSHKLWSWNKYPGITGFSVLLLIIVSIPLSLISDWTRRTMGYIFVPLFILTLTLCVECTMRVDARRKTEERQEEDS